VYNYSRMRLSHPILCLISCMVYLSNPCSAQINRKAVYLNFRERIQLAPNLPPSRFCSGYLLSMSDSTLSIHPDYDTTRVVSVPRNNIKRSQFLNETHPHRPIRIPSEKLLNVSFQIEENAENQKRKTRTLRGILVTIDSNQMTVVNRQNQLDTVVIPYHVIKYIKSGGNQDVMGAIVGFGLGSIIGIDYFTRKYRVPSTTDIFADIFNAAYVGIAGGIATIGLGAGTGIGEFFRRRNIKGDKKKYLKVVKVIESQTD
jgi:hypothetical protein